MKNEGDDYGWGVVVNFSKKSNVKVKYTFSPLSKHILDCFFLKIRQNSYSFIVLKGQKNSFYPEFAKSSELPEVKV